MRDTDSKQAWLEGLVRDQGGVAGTLHVLSETGELHLAAALNIPEKVQEMADARRGRARSAGGRRGDPALKP
jgi:hypothetical protein